MNYYEIFIAVFGGVGLLLTGMWFMTDGLKLAAGNTLRELLSNWTNTRRRALGTGFMITGLVQSSSAVTVATIGFANAGLLSLSEAVWVIFGSNVGTTMTGWIVALVGFKVNMEALALPLIGAGVVIKLFSRKTRSIAIGQTIVGFGLFFLGIFILKDGFADHFANISLPSAETGGIKFYFLYILFGVVLTTLMQSSSAAMVITLGAAESGLIPLGSAAAVVIGANLGTTTTAIISVWGATSTAKRVAVGHVLFNLITASVALIILVPMLSLVAFIQTTTNLGDTPAITLALFHTSFNILGVIIMWPIGERMVKVLNKCFITPNETASKPIYIDVTSLEIPAVALNGLFKEMQRAELMAIQTARNYIISGTGELLTSEKSVVEKLIAEISSFVAKLGQKDLSDKIAASLPTVIQVAYQYLQLDDLSKGVAQLQEKISVTNPDIQEIIQIYKEMVTRVLDSIKPNMNEEHNEKIDENLTSLEGEYEKLKFKILKAGSDGTLGMVSVENLLHQAFLMRQVAREAVKANRRLDNLSKLIDNTDQ